MKIAQIAPLYEAVPPKLYGGTERIVAYLADALVDLGHDVTLFASGDSETRARLAPLRDQAHRLDPEPLQSDGAHCNPELLEFPLCIDIAACTLSTLRGRLDLKGNPGAYRCWPGFPLVS